MRTIDIGIGHDDDLMVTNLAQVERFRVFFGSKGDTQRGEDVAHLFGLEHLVLHRFLHIEDLTAKRENSLVHAVTTGLSGTACRITLDEEEFALCRIFAYAISEFTGQTTTTERRFAEHGLTGVTRCNTRLRRENDLLYDFLRIIGMFLQIVLQSLGNRGIDHTGHLGVTEFGFRLTLKLRLSDFDRDNRRQTFTEIVRVDG